MSYPYPAGLYGPEHEMFRQSLRRFIETEMVKWAAAARAANVQMD